MRNRHLRVLAALLGGSLGAQAQWLNHPTPGTPRTKDGKPDLSAPAPRTAKGKPDLSGVWQAQGAPHAELLKVLPGGVNGLGENDPSRYFLSVVADFKPEDAPWRPGVVERQREEAAKPRATLCEPTSLPMAEAFPVPYKIVQTAGLILMLYEADTNFRQIYLDGRQHPSDPQPTWLGYSVGRWEGDSLVVEVTGFNDRGPLDALGHRHSDALRLTERFHRRDFGHMDVAITIDDPKTFTRPFIYTVSQRLLPDTDLIEYFCTEDEKDLAHMRGQ